MLRNEFGNGCRDLLATPYGRLNRVGIVVIVLEDQARNTRENAIYSAKIVKQRGWQKVLVVTSAFHMKRSTECFNAVDIDFDTYAVDYRATQSPRTWLQPRTHFFFVSSAMLRELFGRFIYRLQGYSRAR